MTIFQSLMHYGSYALIFYAFYVVLGSIAFGYYIWRRVFASNNSGSKGSGPAVPRRADASDRYR